MSEESIATAWKICVSFLKEKGLDKDKRYSDRLISEFKDLKKWDLFVRKDKCSELLQSRVLRRHRTTNPSNSIVVWSLGLASTFDVGNVYCSETFGKSDFPDIDLDLHSGVRDSIKEMLIERFGQERICKIGTVNSYKTRSCIIDVARALGLDVKEATNVTKNLPSEVADEDGEEDISIEKIPIEDIMKADDALNKYLTENDEILTHARILRGGAKCKGVHAGGILVSDRNLQEIIPVFKDKDGAVVSCWSESGTVSELSQLGLVKMDLLVNKNLKIVEDCLSYINKNKGKDIQVKDIPINDHESIRLGLKSDAIGIFQLEADYAVRMCQKANAESIGEISAISALIRPGPRDVSLDQEYVERKKGKKWDKIPIVDDILKDNFGILTYQESISKIAQQVAGFDPIDGNSLRKACSKKVPALIEKYRNQFLEGAKKKVIDTGIMTEEQVVTLYRTIESMAGYAFNKCLDSETPVETFEGVYPIRLVEKGDLVYCPDGWAKVKDVVYNGKKECYSWTIGDKSLLCTKDHKVKVNGIGMVPIYDAYKKCYNVKTDKGSFPVELSSTEAILKETYDLEIDHPSHCFWGGGVAVSNSHAYAYSALTTAEIYLKFHFPCEYLAALLNNTDYSDKKRGTPVFSSYIKYTASKGIPILLPDINKSEVGMTVEGNSIRFGLGQVRNVSSNADGIPTYRPYSSIGDFISRCKSNNRKINIRVVESLLYAGAFDGMYGGSREKAYREFSSIKGGGDSLFESDNVLPDFVAKEGEMLGCKIPEDLYTKHSVVVKDYGCVSYEYARVSEKEVRLCIFGMLSERKSTLTKAGKRCLIVTVTSGLSDFIFRVFENDIDQFDNRYEKGDISLFPLKNMGSDCTDKTFRFYDNKPNILWKIRKGEVIYGN